MKRFFCTVCNRVKRVRKMPVIIQSPDAIDVLLRRGECNYHSQPHAPKYRPGAMVNFSQKTNKRKAS